MSGRDLIFTAPTRCTRHFTNAYQARVRVHLHEQERGHHMRSAPAAADGEVELDRDADWNRFDVRDEHGSSEANECRPSPSPSPPAYRERGTDAALPHRRR